MPRNKLYLPFDLPNTARQLPLGLTDLLVQRILEQGGKLPTLHRLVRPHPRLMIAIVHTVSTLELLAHETVVS
jgi:hypothetical protein